MKAVLSTTLSGMASFVFIAYSSVNALLNDAEERDLLRLSHTRSRLKLYFDFTGSEFPAESRFVPITVDKPLSCITRDVAGPFRARVINCSVVYC